MESKNRLFMVTLGATPQGRVIEQHDVFFGIATSLKELVDEMKAFWPEAKGKIHIDAWREVTQVDGYTIEIIPSDATTQNSNKLFFINLGGYRPNEFEEFHYKILCVAPNMATAAKQAKSSAFYKHCGFKGAESHIDDKYGIDVDDLHHVPDLLSQQSKQKFSLDILPNTGPEDQLHIGYAKIDKLLRS